MSIITTIIVFLIFVGLTIWTGFLVTAGLTTGAIATGTLAIVVIFFTWTAFLGVRGR